MAGGWAAARQRRLHPGDVHRASRTCWRGCARSARLAASVTSKDLAHRGASAASASSWSRGLNEHGHREALLYFDPGVRRRGPRTTAFEPPLRCWSVGGPSSARLGRAPPASVCLAKLPTMQPEGKSDDDSAPSLHLSIPWAHEEVASLWKRLGPASDKKRFVPRFTHDDAERRRTAARMLTNPLVLRTFLEVYAGQRSAGGCPAAPFSTPGSRASASAPATGIKFVLTWPDSLHRQRHPEPRPRRAVRRRADGERDAPHRREAVPFTRLLRREGVLTLVPGESVELAFSMDRYLEQAAGSEQRRRRRRTCWRAKEALGEWPMAGPAGRGRGANRGRPVPPGRSTRAASPLRLWRARSE